jgi:hypothetical protein
MERVINWDIISNPMNWVIIFLTLYLVALIAHMIGSASSSAPIALPSLGNL